MMKDCRRFAGIEIRDAPAKKGAGLEMLEKSGQTTCFIGNRVIKLFLDFRAAQQRIHRARLLLGAAP